MAKTK